MNKDNVALKRFCNRILVVLFWLLIFLIFPDFCQSADPHQHHHHHKHHHHHHVHDENPSYKYSREANEPHSFSDSSHGSSKIETSWMLWAEAFGSTLFISAAPFFILFFVPLDKSREKESLLKILLSFASGGLLGDAFLHLIPHALLPHQSSSGADSSHSKSHGEVHGHDMSVGLSVLMGIVTFLLVEKSVRWIKGDHSHSHNHDSIAVSKKENKYEKGDSDVKNSKKNEGDKGKKAGKKKKKNG